MGFKKEEAEQLLADCGRCCCICGRLHRVQVHHIIPKDQGGTDQISNAIPLCPNCHDEIHSDYVPGRTTRIYTPDELARHRERTIERIKRQGRWSPGKAEWKKDKALILFFAQCLDRPAFRTYFHAELSLIDFDKAMEDTSIALSTGYWRMRDGTLIERGRGKACIVNPQWREKIEDIAEIIEEIRTRFRNALGLNQMINEFNLFPRRGHPLMPEDLMHGFRGDRKLGTWMDEQRQKAIDIMNSLLEESGSPALRGFDHA